MDKNKESNLEYFIERIKTPVIGEYDVVVCGGRVAGVSAAFASKGGEANWLGVGDLRLLRQS